MRKTTLLLMLFCLGFISLAKAQQKTVVYGQLGMENVNVSISNTPVGTSSDAKGQYALTVYDRTKIIHLHYTCIGYRDTIVSLTPKQMQLDSINISFKMRKQNYNLQEVTVTNTHKLYGERYYFMDFEVFDQAICILAACPNKQKRCLIMADEDLRGFDTIHLPERINPERLVRDCMGNCQLIAKDSVYEINLVNEPSQIIATGRAFFFRTMSDCLFTTEEHIYFKEKGMLDYYTSFYRVDRETKEPQQLFINNMADNYIQYWDEMTFYTKHPGGAPSGIWSRFVKKHWFHPSDAELLLTNDGLYYFDQSLGIIRHYDFEIQKIDSCAIQYPFMEGWKHSLYQDLTQNRFYTVIKNKIYEINPLSGNITAITKLIPSLYSKIAIHNGQLFLLKKAQNSAGGTVTFIERRKL